LLKPLSHQAAMPQRLYSVRKICQRAVMSLQNMPKIQSPLSHQTAMSHRMYSVLDTCHRAVESPRNTPKVSNLPVIACTHRPYSVPTRHSHNVFIASMTLLRLLQVVTAACSHRAHGEHTALTKRAYSVVTIIAIKIFLPKYHILNKPFLRTKSSILTFRSDFS